MVLGGNIAYAFKQNGTTWRAVPIGLAIASFVIALAVGLGIKEPPKGKYIIHPKAGPLNHPVLFHKESLRGIV